ncbi:type II secretion system F family protein [Fonticella tunisiensis]|uniref:Type IV pilus assembly protein PilC n=1 Tax=Fonticella tunisiensis TaxID=1096341 RepID=A0A4V6Q2Z7_9CLOT|nr:type II secretion system F family protein [Fonticella tunisiensis]TDT61969.1 type IV pilus assembly protein PilC [Fonticella tunisiensis]
MPVFEYEAKTLQGTTVRGKTEAVDEAAVTNYLRSNSYYPVRIKQYRESMNISLGEYKKVGLKDISIFCRQFSVIIASGISILRALEIVREQTENKKLKKILTTVFDDVQKGKGLSDAMGMHREFPEMLVNMVQVGEASGTLDRVMERMAVYYEKEYRLNQKIKQALTYPATVSIFALIVVIILVVKVLPTFVNMIGQFGGGELPLPTRIVMGLSSALQNNGLLITVLMAGIIMLTRIYLKSREGRNALDKFRLNAPLMGKIYKKIITARFARTFGNLMGSGLPILESISICSKVVGNSIIEKMLNDVREDLKKGTGLGDALSVRGIFPMMLTQMIKIGEESGTLDSILEKTAEFYDGEIESVTAQLTTMIEPVIIITLASVVGFIILSIILPIFQMYQMIG